MHPLDRAGFGGTARGFGLDSQAPLENIDSGRFAREIQADLEYGANIGVNGTPTFLINGLPMIGAQPLLRFVEVINRVLGQKPIHRFSSSFSFHPNLPMIEPP